MSWQAQLAATLLPGRSREQGPLPPLLVTLTVLTGVVDATSYLRLGHVFVANMTGNVVFLGFAIAGAKGLSVASSLTGLLAFLAGAALGGRLGGALQAHRGRLLAGCGTLQSVLLVTALGLALAASTPSAGGVRYVLTALLALAMGVQNAAAQRLAVPELTTTVLTRTLTGFAADARLLGGPGADAPRRIVAVAAMLGGAIAGGLLALDSSVAAALVLAAGLSLLVCSLAWAAARSRAPWTEPAHTALNGP